MKRLAILTSGGDCSGMNAAIRAAARTAAANDVEMIGYRKGFAGLLKNDFLVLDTRAVSGVLQRGGTFLDLAVRHIQIGFIQGDGFDKIGEFMEDPVNLSRNSTVRFKPGP